MSQTYLIGFERATVPRNGRDYPVDPVGACLRNYGAVLAGQVWGRYLFSRLIPTVRVSHERFRAEFSR